MDATTLSHQLAKACGRPATIIHQLWQLTSNSPLSRSYYPEEPIKAKPRVLADLLWWLLRNGEVNHYYYVYGLDRKRTDRSQELLPYRKFRRIRNGRNLRVGGSGFNYVCLLRDKFVFSHFVANLGIPTPVSLALLDSKCVNWLDTNEIRPLHSIAERVEVNFDGFCKKLGGIQGKGAFPLRMEAGSLYVGEHKISAAELARRLDDRYLLQEKIIQHEAMSAIHPASVNTVRLITFATTAGIEVFAAAMRVGTHAACVDNWAAGGLIVGVDLERGELRGEGFYKPGYGGRTDRHPDTGIAFRGFKIPYFFEAAQLVCRLHGYLRGIHSIGWDVAITPKGPTIIEGNDDWEGGIPMALERNFRQRFLGMYK